MDGSLIAALDRWRRKLEERCRSVKRQTSLRAIATRGSAACPHSDDLAASRCFSTPSGSERERRQSSIARPPGHPLGGQPGIGSADRQQPSVRQPHSEGAEDRELLAPRVVDSLSSAGGQGVGRPYRPPARTTNRDG